MKTIMIVEDEEAISRVLTTYIQKGGYNCVGFARGTDAVEQLETLQPALILLDVMLPGMDGWEVLREVRRRNDCPVHHAHG